MSNRDVHLVGSVNLASAEDVFRQCAVIYGGQLKRVPDGETGERRVWTEWQYTRLAAHPLLKAASSLNYGRYAGLERLKLRDPATRPEDLQFEPPGYAEVALRSYEQFAALKDAGEISPGTRFLVALPTPLAVLEYVTVEDTPVVEPAYQQALLGDLSSLCARIPHSDLAVQWDVCHEMAVLEGLLDAPFPDPLVQFASRLAVLGGAVPDDVELGYHFCYGSWQEQHFSEPTDTRRVVELANAMFARVGRPVQFVHLPVPIDRDDAAYFAPLADLRAGPDTELYLGLVHAGDGIEGARRRAAAAAPYAGAFGVAEECGLGRGERSTMVERLRTAAEVAASV